MYYKNPSPDLRRPLVPAEIAVKHSITLEDQFWEIAKQLGQGNASYGIRLALARCKQQETQP